MSTSSAVASHLCSLVSFVMSKDKDSLFCELCVGGRSEATIMEEATWATKPGSRGLYLRS